MRSSKQQSITSDTRPSFSHHDQSLNLSRSNYLTQQIANAQNKEVEFLRLKNKQLTERVNKSVQEIKKLEQDKHQLMTMNQKYIEVVSEYERKAAEKKNQQRKPKSGKGSVQVGEVLAGLEKDHRNLVKHCLTMELEIKNYAKEMRDYEQLQAQLRAVNHTTVSDLVHELFEAVEKNKQLRVENNKLSYQLEKVKLENSNNIKAKASNSSAAEKHASDLAQAQRQLNTLEQQKTDAANRYEARIYELQLKVAKLEHQLRQQQTFCQKQSDKQRQIRLIHIQDTEECHRLRKNIHELLEGRGDRQRAKSTVRSTSFCH